MIDRQAFPFVPGDITGLLRRLNAAPMCDILDTLDALLKEKSFYPNVGQYRTQLDSAGIFVQRMVVAMSAVMARNGNQTSFDQFAARNSDILAQLPEAQRNDIAAYFTGSATTLGLTKSKLIEQYLAWAKLAVFRTRSALDRGAPNRADDIFKGSPIVAFGDRSTSDKPEETAEFAKKYGAETAMSSLRLHSWSSRKWARGQFDGSSSQMGTTPLSQSATKGAFLILMIRN